MGTSAQTQQQQVKRLLVVVNWRPFHNEGHFLACPCSCLWPGNEHKRDNPDGHGELQQLCNVLGGGEHDDLQSMATATTSTGASSDFPRTSTIELLSPSWSRPRLRPRRTSSSTTSSSTTNCKCLVPSRSLQQL